MPTNIIAFNTTLMQIQNNQIIYVGLTDAGITDTDCILLANVLQNNTSVVELDLSNTGGSNTIGSICIQALAEALQVNKKLQILSLVYCNIGVNGAQALSNMLHVNKVLQSLDLEGGALGPGGGQAITQALRVNTGLTFLGLWYNQLDYSTAVNIAQMLQDNVTLKSINLSGNSFGANGIQIITEALQYNYLMTTINVDNTYGTQINILLARNRQCAANTLICPLISINQLTIQNGTRIIVTPQQLQIMDVNRNLLLGNFTVNNVGHGVFSNLANQTINYFSQEDVNECGVMFQHDGSGVAPVINVIASYNGLSTWPQAAKVNFTLFNVPNVVCIPVPTTPLTTITTTFTTTSTTYSTTLPTIAPNAFDIIISEIQHNQITIVALSSSGITDAQCVTLANALRSNTSLQILYLNNNLIGDTGVTALAQAISTHPSLLFLELDGNVIGMNGGIVLGQMLKNNTILQQLSLVGFGNQIGDGGTIAIAQALQMNTALQTLDLYGNGIGDNGAIALAQMLSVNQSLLNLILNDNVIAINGVIALAQALQVNHSLRELYLQDNRANNIGDNGAIAFAQTLKVNTALKTLSLITTTMGDVGATAIAQALEINHSLNVLFINNNFIGDIGAQAIAQALKINISLKKLTLYINPSMTSIGIGLITDALVHNFVLTSLSVDPTSYDLQINNYLVRNQRCALQCPIIPINQLAIKNGTRVTLTPNNLQITDVNHGPLSANVSVSDVTHGTFLNSQNQPITNFSPANIAANQVLFQHDGSGLSPSYNIIVIYNNWSTWPIPVIVNFSGTATTITSPTTSTSTAHISSLLNLSITTTPTTALSNAQATVSSSASSISVGALIGGIAGALVAGAGIVWAYFRFRKTKVQTQLATFDDNQSPIFHINNPLANASSPVTLSQMTHTETDMDADWPGYDTQHSGQPAVYTQAGAYHKYEKPVVGLSGNSYSLFNIPAAAQGNAAPRHRYEYAESRNLAASEAMLFNTPYDLPARGMEEYGANTEVDHSYDIATLRDETYGFNTKKTG
jgi:Ran GTPase-activating protein (RanGAP) involved in mRNA processing and transport